MRKTRKDAGRFEYKGQRLTLNQIMKIKGWPYSLKQTKKRLKEGQKVKDLVITPADKFRKIMSVPVNVKKTQEYYIMQNFTHRGISNLGAASQSRRRDV